MHEYQVIQKLFITLSFLGGGGYICWEKNLPRFTYDMTKESAHPQRLMISNGQNQTTYWKCILRTLSTADFSYIHILTGQKLFGGKLILFWEQILAAFLHGLKAEQTVRHC